ncbi:bifunctional diguanylate cyclase/phosphodiesterase [Dactylosporangium sp. NPDC049525]|uniref:putative bifunctional diguanylate cyclase/phosphodiesterase n=1 Tax=Dactylosporangium sp. NPDC049525 TaxID=3154730 RepID=UPI00344671D7
MTSSAGVLPRVEPDGEFRRVSGRAISAIFVIGGLLTCGLSMSLAGSGALVTGVLLGVGAVAALAGLVLWRLPWQRWSRRASLWTLVPALLLMSLGNWAEPDPYLATIFYFLLAVWVGTAQRRGTTLLLSPVFAVTYWAPLALADHAPGLENSVFYVTATCVLAGECVAWLTTRLHGAQQRLREHDERRFQALLAASSDATMVIAADGRFSYVSPNIARLLRLPVGDIRALDAAEIVARHVRAEDAARVHGRLAHLLSHPGTEETVRFQVTAGSGWRDVEGIARNLCDDEDVRGVLVTLRDVSERTNLERALTEQAFTDQLTGLPNRVLLQDRTGRLLRDANRQGRPCALLLIDLDRFKEVNDTLGHHNGDLLLQQVARRLTGVLRDTDTVARLGGDEFAVLLPDVGGLDDAMAAAAKITAALETPFLLEGLSLEVDGSVGVAVYPVHALDAAQLLQRADVAMYAAKTGHLGHVAYDPRLDRHNPHRLGLLGQLRRAIAGGELVLFYQPKADARTGAVIGAEALVRWQHPEHGLLGPNEFIPLAETTGLIRQLTSYVLATALRDCRAWHDAGHDVSVAVNVSARCLLDLDLPLEIQRLTEQHAVPTHRLVVEITESVIMSDPTRALEVLNRLHALGVRLSIDDFGTGYSSLAYLKNLPVQELKVDRSFVTHMRERQSELAIVRSTVDLGHNLGMRVVAEGVEDAATWQALSALGCDEIQGYFLSRPMPSADVVPWLGTRRARPLTAAAIG